MDDWIGVVLTGVMVVVMGVMLTLLGVGVGGGRTGTIHWLVWVGMWM